MSRLRASLCLTTALAVALPGLAAAQTLTPVTFGTNWVAQAEHGGYYQALVDGTYAACGLDVTILPGGPQVNNEAQLIAGRIQFYMGGQLGVLLANESGVPLRAVAADFQKDPQVIMTHPGKIESFDQIASLDQLIISDGGFVTYFKYFETADGWDAAKRVPYTFNPAPFIANPASAQQGYLTSEPFAIAREGGFEPDVWLLADHGYAPYSTMIVTMQEVIDKMPEAVACFVEGSAKGWANFLYGDNAAALERIKQDNPDKTDEQLAYSIAKLIEFGIVDSGDALTLGIGAMTDERFNAFYEQMVEVGVIGAGLDVASTYSLEFTNNGASLEIKAALGVQ
jgi:NitT/TauT family transport system substrate-binding protein